MKENSTNEMESNESIKKIKPLMLTTKDNPYNPFTEFNLWYNFDVLNGYNSCQMLDLFSIDLNDASEVDQIYFTNEAIKEIVKNDLTGMYKAVEKED